MTFDQAQSRLLIPRLLTSNQRARRSPQMSIYGRVRSAEVKPAGPRRAVCSRVFAHDFPFVPTVFLFLLLVLELLSPRVDKQPGGRRRSERRSNAIRTDFCAQRNRPRAGICARFLCKLRVLPLGLHGGIRKTPERLATSRRIASEWMILGTKSHG